MPPRLSPLAVNLSVNFTSVFDYANIKVALACPILFYLQILDMCFAFKSNFYNNTTSEWAAITRHIKSNTPSRSFPVIILVLVRPHGRIPEGKKTFS